MENKTIQKYLTKDEIVKLLNVSLHIGNSAQRALRLARKIKNLKNL